MNTLLVEEKKPFDSRGMEKCGNYKKVILQGNKELDGR